MLIGMFYASISWADTDRENAKKQLLELLKPITGFSAQFTQQLLDSERNSILTQSGELHGQKPDKLYWHVLQPSAQEIVSNGVNLWLYDADLEQVIIQPYSHNPEANPISLLLGGSQLFVDNFQLVDHRQSGDSTIQFSLEPLQPNALYSGLILEFDQGILSAISFTDSLGQTTQLNLHQLKLNPVFDGDFFTFSIPKGVDVVDHVQ